MSRLPKLAPIPATLLFAVAGLTATVRAEAPALQPSLTLTGEFWGNASGGRRTGSHWNTLVDLALELDLARLGGPTGGSLFAQLQWVENRHNAPGFGDLTGTANSVSNSMAADHLRLFNFYYRQSWSDDRFTLKLGQLTVDDDFMVSDFAGLFTFASFGAIPSVVATPLSVHHDHNAAIPSYAVAAPGLCFSSQVTDQLSLHAGFFHGGPGPDTSANLGVDYDTGHGVGPVLFYESRYRFSLGGRASTLRAGGSVHFGRFDDFAALNAGVDAATVRGIHSFYAIQDLVLLAADADHPKLAAFWRAGLSTQQDRSVVHRYADAGLNWFAPLPGRADDIAGIAISYTEYGRSFRRTDAALAAAETAVELTYRAQVTESFALQAIIQRHNDPLPRDDAHRHPATVVGLRAEWSY